MARINQVNTNSALNNIEIQFDKNSNESKYAGVRILHRRKGQQNNKVTAIAVICSRRKANIGFRPTELLSVWIVDQILKVMQ
jgi:hypothetical protein